MTEKETENLGERFVIDAKRGNFTVQAFAEGLFSFVGHNPTFVVRRYGGEIQLAENNSDIASMLVVVQSNSLALLDKVNKTDRAEIENSMNEKVLETSKFPEIFFVSKNVSLDSATDGKLTSTAKGVLSLHGEKKAQTIEADTEITSGTIRAFGEFSLKQSDFNIEQFRAMGGTLKVKDEVKISFDITARM